MADRPTYVQKRDIAPPQVFISSTFEELLKDIRDLLRSELEEDNFLPIMSELGSFAYSHDGSAIYDDTIRTVATSQIYVLVIGRKYGSLHPEHNRSITELEYEAAREASLPTFAYVQSKVWDGYHAHKNGAIASGKHSHWVDDENVFDFIDRVAQVDGCRCVPFAQARDIVLDFKSQMANLLGGHLRFEGKVASWLWNEWRTRAIESDANLVWVITPNFYWDYQDTEFRRIVFENVTERRVGYCYIFRDTLDNQSRIDEMIRDYSSEIGERWREHVRYAAVPANEFNWCTEQVLYNPYDPQREHGILVDIMDVRNKLDKHNIELGRDKRVDFRGQFERLWKLYGVGDPRTLQ